MTAYEIHRCLEFRRVLFRSAFVSGLDRATLWSGRGVRRQDQSVARSSPDTLKARKATAARVSTRACDGARWRSEERRVGKEWRPGCEGHHSHIARVGGRVAG